MRALIVEDDPKLAGYVAQALREESWAVDVAVTGPEGSLLARTEPYDAILLDVMLPGKRGFRNVAGLRAAGVRTPILMLTAPGIAVGGGGAIRSPCFMPSKSFRRLALRM